MQERLIAASGSRGELLAKRRLSEGCHDSLMKSGQQTRGGEEAGCSIGEKERWRSVMKAADCMGGMRVERVRGSVGMVRAGLEWGRMEGKKEEERCHCKVKIGAALWICGTLLR
ncbi:hypothetical protein PAT3040_01733 [Paenibacillus agaridevorans]|uniref:Uncharacterized protein n=1 Tax=Paenibacillus agaridevorans TaxID=171404 RepID=A0A2R5EM52_9BACL|nr:hypothetical protein PAT3040_01733 [Paenibacillus agaridevorans]